MKLSRIEACAFIKSAIEAGIKSEHWPGVLEKAAEAMEAIAGPVGSSPAPQAPPSAPSPRGGVSLRVVALEDHGKRVRVEASGYQGGKYFTAWDKNADVARGLVVGQPFSATVVEKPNPKSKYPHLNLEDIKPGADSLADVRVEVPDDIPF